VRRAALIWLALFAVYAATIGIHAAGHRAYGGDEPHYLLMAESIVSDADIDLRDEYRTRAYRHWYRGTLTPNGRLTDGRLQEPQPVGVSLLIAPAYAVGGARAAELELAALMALAFVLAIALARRLVPEPWATAGPVVCALSPPVLAYATTVYPETAAAAVLAGAALLALRSRERPRLRSAIAAGLLLALLPWLGVKYVVAGTVIALALSRWLVRRRRAFHALVAVEAVVASVVVWFTVNGQLYHGLTPYAAGLPGHPTADSLHPGDVADRVPRLLALWIDRQDGLLRWAPVFALSFFAVWLLWRSRRERVARAVPERADVEIAAGLLAAVAGAQVLVATFAAPSLAGAWFPGRHLVAALPAAAALAAWGLRHARRVGALLCGLTLAASAWLYVALRVTGASWAQPPQEIPWGPLDWLLPRYGSGSTWAAVVAGAVVAAIAAAVLREWRQTRRPAAGAAAR
jgi:hypothetical protein